MVSHAMQQYLPEVVIQEQIGCAHFWALWVAISILLVENHHRKFHADDASLRGPVCLYKREHRGSGRVSLIEQIGYRSVPALDGVKLENGRRRHERICDRADSGFPFCNRRYDCWPCGPVLAEQVGRFTLERVDDDGKVSFKAIGRIDFLEEDALTQLSGAGGRNWTERLPMRFEWLAAA
jgi:hypothetical protein